MNPGYELRVAGYELSKTEALRIGHGARDPEPRNS